MTDVPIIISFICFALVLVPLPWHWRARNIPTVMCLIWVSGGNLFHGVTAAIWKDNVRFQALPFCDIGLAFQIASIWGMNACGFCITHHLENVASPRYSTTGLSDPRNRRWFEIIMTIVSPWVFAAIHLIVQGHRFDIIEGVGCTPSTYWSWPAIWLYYVPPLVLSACTSYYAAFALRWFIQRRAQFHDLLSQSGFTQSRYVRLMGLAMIELLGSVGMNLYILISNTRLPLRPWINWDNVHYDFGRVAQVPRAVMTAADAQAEWGAWSIYPICGVLVFAMFGFGQEAVLEYKKTGQWIRVNIFRLPPDQRPSGGTVGLPSFVASPSMVSQSQSQEKSRDFMSSSSRSGRSVNKWDPTLTLDFDNDSLYDADEQRGRRSVALGDLEAASGTESFDEKSYAVSLAPSEPQQHHHQRMVSVPPVPSVPLQIPEAAMHRISRTSSIDELDSPTTPTNDAPRAL